MNINKSGFMLDENQELFLKVKRLEQISEEAIKNYKSCFSTIDRKINERLNYKDESVLCNQILNFFSEISDQKPSSYNTKVKNFNCFFNYLVKIGKIKNNPLKVMGIKSRKDEFNPRPCDTEDLKKLLKAVDVKTYSGLRDYCVILLIADTGIRPSEAFRLEITDLNFPENMITVRKEISKTKKARVLPTSTKVMIYIRALLKYNMDSPYVFNTIHSKQMSPDRFQKRLQHYSDYSGVKITPYQLRHYFGTEYTKSDNCNLLYLQQIMGHADLEMTRRYVKIDTKDLARNHKLASPIDKLD